MQLQVFRSEYFPLFLVLFTKMFPIQGNEYLYNFCWNVNFMLKSVRPLRVWFQGCKIPSKKKELA